MASRAAGGPRRLRSRRSRGPWRAPRRGRRGRSSCCRGRPRSRRRGTGAAGRASRGASALRRPPAGVVVAAQPVERPGDGVRGARRRRGGVGGPGELEGPGGIAVVGLEQGEVQVDDHAVAPGRAGSPRRRGRSSAGAAPASPRAAWTSPSAMTYSGSGTTSAACCEPPGGLRQVALARSRGVPGRPARAGARARAARARSQVAPRRPRIAGPAFQVAEDRQRERPVLRRGAGLLGGRRHQPSGGLEVAVELAGGTTSGRATRGPRRRRTSARRPPRLRRTGRARRAHRPRPPWAAVSAGRQPHRAAARLGARRRTGDARAGARRAR